MKALHIADLFCGAGGTSTGAIEAAEACGFRAHLTAVNHWDVAIATHEANHPGARHLCTGIDDINPRTLFSDGQLDVLWASPECTHHSVARGGRPINEQSRATAWCVVRWAEAIRPAVILVENVPEFVTWGGLCSDGRPLKAQRGKTFAAWIAALESLGYRVDWRVLCAADYGDPTTRRRLFVQAVRGKRKIVWPEPTHIAVEEGDMFTRRKPWVPAREIIDWTLPGESIYERKKPLSEKTMARIFEGLRKFGLKPFITPGQGERDGQSPRTHSVDDPAPTVAASGHLHLAEPFIVGAGGPEYAAKPQPVSAPMTTVTAANHRGLVQAFILPQHSTNGARSVDNPAPTVTTTSRGIGLAEPFLVCMEHAGCVRSAGRPMPTITTAKGGAIGIAQPFLVKLRGTSDGADLDQPSPTVTASGGHLCLAEPFLIEYYGTGGAESVAEPLNTVTAKERHALVRPTVTLDGHRYRLDIRFRMLQPHELAGAQGFRKGYLFTGNKTQQVKQIGNAVPRRLARAIVTAALTQRSDVAWLDQTPAAA